MSRKPPKRLTISGVQYDVVMVKKLQSRSKGKKVRYFGLCYFLPARIKIEKRQQPAQKAATMLHEVFHAIFHHTGHDTAYTNETQETMIKALSQGLVDVFQRNPELLEWIGEQVKE